MTNAAALVRPRSSLRRARNEHAIDAHVGERIKARRRELGLSQERLGLLIGPVTFQQLQKYEKGSNRVAASRLAMIAKALDVPVGYFFPD